MKYLTPHSHMVKLNRLANIKSVQIDFTGRKARNYAEVHGHRNILAVFEHAAQLRNSILSNPHLDWGTLGKNNGATSNITQRPKEKSDAFSTVQNLSAKGWRLGLLPLRDDDGTILAVDATSLYAALTTHNLRVYIVGLGKGCVGDRIGPAVQPLAGKKLLSRFCAHY
eukprot:SAG31_NODE_1479_length_8180_cov_7.141684_3_plen_168_part_00